MVPGLTPHAPSIGFPASSGRSSSSALAFRSILMEVVIGLVWLPKVEPELVRGIAVSGLSASAQSGLAR